MEDHYYLLSYILSTFFEFYIISKFMKMFLGAGTQERKYLVAAYTFRFVACGVQYSLIPNVVLNLIFGFSTLFIISLCYQGNIINKIIAVVLVFVCLFTAEAVVAGILALGNVQFAGDERNGDTFSNLGIVMALWIIYEIIKTFKNINRMTVLPKLFDIIIILLSIMIFSMETVIFLQKNISKSIKILSSVCMLLILFLIIYLYDMISKNYMERIQSELVEREKNYYLKQAELLQQGEKELKDFRHDMNNHLYALGSMLREGEGEAKRYIENLTKKIKQTNAYCQTGNIALDSVINYKLTEAEEWNIRIEMEITLPSGIQEEIVDVIAIIGNLLDNAIEASKTIDENRFLFLKMKYKCGVLFITVKNAYDGIISCQNGEIRTRKDDKALHGIGLKSVRTVVEHYNGNMEIEYDEQVFCVRIMIYTE